MIDYRENNKWTVYIHISPSNKCYVGITSKKPKDRWGKNGNGYKYNTHFYRAIEKYGWDNFQHEIIAEHLTKDEACCLEKSIIKSLSLNNPLYGYNKTLGGEGRSYEHKDLSGQVFGFLQVNKLSKETGNNGERKWDCNCLLCGCNTTKFENTLKDGSTISCGCYGKTHHQTAMTHGKSYEKLYKKFIDIKGKCFNKNNSSYYKYGKKGVTVCKEWMDDFMNFYDWSLKNGYSDNKVLYLNKGCVEFSPQNCKWITKSEQQSLDNGNRKYITYNEETHSIREWAEIMGTTYTRLKDALRKKSFDEAFLFYTK